MDSLKEFTQQHREAFDTHRPGQMVWKSLEMELDKHTEIPKVVSVKRLSRWARLSMGIAACVILLAGLGLGMLLQQQSYRHDHAAIQELKAAEAYYNVRLDSKKKELQLSNPTIEYEDELQELDIIYEELRAELLKDPDANTDLLINSMKRNFETKLEILDRIQSKLDQQYKKEQNEEINI